MNLSSFDIPYNIQCFLQLGENFALPFNNKNKIIFEYIKNIESSTQRMPIDRRIEVTNYSIPILNNIISSPTDIRGGPRSTRPDVQMAVVV